MNQQEAKAALDIIGLGACCGSCAVGGPCDGLGRAGGGGGHGGGGGGGGGHGGGHAIGGVHAGHGGSGIRGSGLRHGSGFRGGHRRFGGRGWGWWNGSWVWWDWWPQTVVVYDCPPGYVYDLFGNCVPCTPTTCFVDGYGNLVAGVVGLGMDYTDKPTPGDYHVKGTGVILRASPSYTSKEIATLQNGENVYVLGDVETDPNWQIVDNDQVIPNTPDSKWLGIDYIHVGTQKNGSGWIAMAYVEPGAGIKFGTQTPTPTPSPAPSKVPGMGLPTKILLGGAIAATVAGGGFLIWKAAKDYRPRHMAPA